jgi:membrane protein implicated in regulation of membrane protease activity
VPLRYALFQIPDLILLGLGLAAAVRWWGLSLPSAYLIVGFWLVKDIVVFPLLRVAYETSGPSPADRLTGAIGVARQSLDPSGYVSVGAELWNAELAAESPPLAAGSAIRVIQVDGLKLLVEALPSDESL